jgi:hypothetical protein
VRSSDSIQRIRDGIIAATFIISGHDQRWRMNASCVEIALRRIAVFQSRPPSVDGSSTSLVTRSIIPTRISSLFATWL